MFRAYCNDFVYEFVRFLITPQLPGLQPKDNRNPPEGSCYKFRIGSRRVITCRPLRQMNCLAIP